MLINQLTNDIDMYLSYSKLLNDNHKVVFLSESESNINFLIDVGAEKYIFRLNKISQLNLRNQIRYEYDALKVLEKSYVTPRTFFLDDSTTFFDYGVLIMQYISGRHLDYEKDLHEAAKILSKIHSLNFNEINTSNFIKEENIIESAIDKSKDYLKEFLKSPKVDTKIKIFFYKFLNWAEKNKDKEKFFLKDKWDVINNTDLESRNFIISDRKGYLIDWEKPIITDPSRDIAHFLSPTTTLWNSDYILSEDEQDDFFKTYIMNLDKRDRDIVERVRIYTPFLYLKTLSSCAAKFIEYKNSDEENIDKHVYKKVNQYLDIDFMTKLVKDINIIDEFI